MERRILFLVLGVGISVLGCYVLVADSSMRVVGLIAMLLGAGIAYKMGSMLWGNKDAKVGEPPPPEFPESLTYTHENCGTVTHVGSPVLENMHADPYFYAKGLTECAKCGLVRESQCIVEETGERLDAYVARLRHSKGTMYHVVRWGIFAFAAIAGGTVGLFLDPLLNPQWQVVLGRVFLGMLVGCALAFRFGRFLRLALCQSGTI